MQRSRSNKDISDRINNASQERIWLSRFGDETGMASLAEKLKQRRESLNLTQQQVADELGVTVTTVKNWEAGRHIPKLYLPQTKALCDLLRLSLDELVD